MVEKQLVFVSYAGLGMHFGGTFQSGREVHGKDFTHSLIHLAHLVSCWREEMRQIGGAGFYAGHAIYLYPDERQTKDPSHQNKQAKKQVLAK